MDPATIAFIASLGIKGLGSLFGHKAAKKKAANTRAATISGLNIQQKQKEDARRARLQLGSSILGRVPKTTAGGGVNTNVGLDPELVKALGVERTYDFGSAVPDESAGGGSAFLSGLFGGIGDTIPYLVGGRQGGSQAAAAAGPINGVDLGGGPGGVNTTSVNSGLSFDDLMKLLNTHKAADGTAPPISNDWTE